MIVKGIFDSFRTIGWVCLLLSLVLYACAIFCVYMSGEEKSYPSRNEEEPETWLGVADFNNWQQFGTILRAMYTLFCVAILAEWMELGRAMVEYQPEMIFFFILFIIFTSFGVMNVVIGVIVDNTMLAARAAEKDQVEFDRRQRVSILDRIRELIFALDKDGSGEVSYDELKAGLDMEDVTSLLKTVGFPSGFEPEEVMDLLDADGDGVLSMNEFMVSLFRIVYCDPFQQKCLMQSNLHAVRRALRNMRKDTTSIMEKLDVRAMSLEELLGGLPPEPCAGAPPYGEVVSPAVAAPGSAGGAGGGGQARYKDSSAGGAGLLLPPLDFSGFGAGAAAKGGGAGGLGGGEQSDLELLCFRAAEKAAEELKAARERGAGAGEFADPAGQKQWLGPRLIS